MAMNVNSRQVNDLCKHVAVLNCEVGKIKKDISWLRWTSSILLVAVITIALKLMI